MRQARRARYPDPLYAALLAEEAGADSITLHLREDRRHIQDRDVTAMREALQTRMNLEMAVTEEMIRIAQQVLPQDCCLVPESRQEVTTEGGSNVSGQSARDRRRRGRRSARRASASRCSSIRTAAQIEAAQRAGAPVIELHTGAYADATGAARAREFERLRSAAKFAASLGLDRECGSRPQLSQRRADRGHPGNRRAQHRPRDRGARRSSTDWPRPCAT